MSQRARILIAVGVLALLVTVVLGVEIFRRQVVAPAPAGQPTVEPGSIPIYLQGQLVGSFTPADLERLQKVSFVEPAEGKTQEGWLLRDILLLYLPQEQLQPDTLITISSSSRAKSAQVTWAEADRMENWVMFDLSNRGTLKLVSVLEKLDSRDEWVPDVDRIEVENP